MEVVSTKHRPTRNDEFFDLVKEIVDVEVRWRATVCGDDLVERDVDEFPRIEEEGEGGM